MTLFEKLALCVAVLFTGTIGILTIIYLFQGITMPHSQVVVPQVNVILPSGSIISSTSSNTKPKNLSDNETLKKQANELADNISVFVGDWDVREKKLIPYFNSNYNMTNHNESLKEWINNTNERNVFEAEALRSFNEQYLGNVSKYRQEFAKRNITDRLLDAFLWSPNYQWMHNIPVSLHEMASKLP